MDFISDYIVLVILGICYCVGFMIKNVIRSESVDRFIPIVVGVLGVFLNIWANNWSVSPDIILGGLASGLAATGTNQIFKQLAKDDEDDAD